MAEPFNPLQVGDPNGDGNPLYAGSPTLADAWRFNANATQDWLDQQRAISAQRGLWNPETGLPTQAGLIDAAQQYGSGVMMGTTAPEARGFTAPIRPASESVPRAMDATFTYGKDLGPKMMPIDQLTGGTSTSSTEAARVADLKERMAGDNGYISRLIVDSNGNVIEGQHRLEALRQLGATKVPVHVVHDLADGVDTKGLQVSIRGAQQMAGDQSKQLIGHVLDAVHEEGSVAAARAAYDPPPGYGPAWNAALDFLDKPAQEAAPGIRAFHGSPHSSGLMAGAGGVAAASQAQAAPVAPPASTPWHSRWNDVLQRYGYSTIPTP